MMSELSRSKKYKQKMVQYLTLFFTTHHLLLERKAIAKTYGFSFTPIIQDDGTPIGFKIEKK